MKLIVVIEDNRDNRLLVSSLLSDFYATTENQTGFEIFCGLQDKILELILLDISLRNQCQTPKMANRDNCFRLR